MKSVNLIYGVKDKPGFWKTLLFAFQQVLAILAATIVVPVIINGSDAGVAAGANMSQSAALVGAGLGTLVYLLFTGDCGHARLKKECLETGCSSNLRYDKHNQ